MWEKKKQKGNMKLDQANKMKTENNDVKEGRYTKSYQHKAAHRRK